MAGKLIGEPENLAIWLYIGLSFKPHAKCVKWGNRGQSGRRLRILTFDNYYGGDSMMLSKDATSIIGKIGFLLPLLLILFIATDAAAACPEYRTSAAYRTTAVNTRTVAYTAPTVITYRAPASYRLCGDSLYDTRRVRYVVMRSNGYRNGSGARYVAVRNGYYNGNSARYVAIRNGNGNGYHKVSRTRYIAVRNVDIDDDAPRYVAVRRAPVYIERPATRYVAVRNIDIDDDEDLRYVAVRRHPTYMESTGTRYVAVRNVAIDDDDDDLRYVAVRRYPTYVANTDTRYPAVRNVDIDDDCPRYVAMRSCSEYTSGNTRYVVLRNGNGYSNGTRYVALRNGNGNGTKYVQYTDAAYSNGNGASYITTSDNDDACLLSVAHTSPEIVSTRTVSYVRDDDDDIDIDDDVDETKYVAATARTVSYEPMDDDDIDRIAFHNGISDSARTMSYVSTNDTGIDNDETMYIAASDVDDPCLRRVAVRTCPDDLSTSTVSYVPVDNVNVRTVSYVPTNNVYHTDKTDIAIRDCPTEVSSVDTDTTYVVDTSVTPVETIDASTRLVETSDTDVGYTAAQRIARDYGYRDGLEDGQEAALERDAYHPENSGDYEKATNGYEDTFGDKDLYKEAYRSAYLGGYRSGFNSIASRGTVALVTEP